MTAGAEQTKTIDRSRLQLLLEKEQQRFEAEHPRSLQMFEQAKKSLLSGVPMNWMVKWAGKFLCSLKRRMVRTLRTWTAKSTLTCAWAIPAP